jgi:hypothetical protein
MTKRILMASAITAICLATGAAARQKENARDLFYARPANTAAGQEAWAGVRTSIVLRTAGENGECVVREVSEGDRFHNGDRFRLRVQANGDGYLYVFLRGDEGEAKVLFPYNTPKGRVNKVKRFQPRSVPAAETDWFRFDEDAGIERVYLFYSQKPLAELDKLVKSGEGSISARLLDRMVARMAGNRPLTFDEGDLDDSGVGATYYVEKLEPKHDYLVRRFELVHRP